MECFDTTIKVLENFTIQAMHY